MSSWLQPFSITASSEIRTGAWYGDVPLALSFPSEWNVEVRWPNTPRRSTDNEISSCLARPIGKPSIADLCRGKSRPLVIVDDLNRPTPASRVLPFVLRQFQRAGIAANAVRILLSTGTHGRQAKRLLLARSARTLLPIAKLSSTIRREIVSPSARPLPARRFA